MVVLGEDGVRFDLDDRERQPLAVDGAGEEAVEELLRLDRSLANDLSSFSEAELLGCAP